MRVPRSATTGIVLAACLAATAARADGERVDGVEASVQAAYLYQFLRFVEWPAAHTAGAVRVCVLGRDPFGAVLDRAMNGRRVGGRGVELVRLGDDLGPAPHCSLVFLSAAEQGRLPELRAAVSGRPLLLVSDDPDFALKGGTIGFFRENDRVRFEVNVAAAERAGLRVSSRMLDVARVVGRDGVAGR